MNQRTCHVHVLSSPDEKPGTCPEIPADMFGLCAELCTGDDSCEGAEKCCSNGCGHVCKAPVPGKKTRLDTPEMFISDAIYLIVKA